jgi:hypothetical protein
MAGPAGWPPSAASAPQQANLMLLGRGDHADPTVTSAGGDTPGTAGINDHSDRNAPRAGDRTVPAPGAVVQSGGRVVAVGSKVATIDRQSRRLAALAYGEAGVKDVADEIAAIAWAVANRCRAYDHKTVDQILVVDPHYAYAATNPNARYKKLMGASADEIAADVGMATALKAATDALASTGRDPSNGAFWWDGKDFGTNPNHPKRLQSFHYGDPSHNLFKVDEVADETTLYWKDRNGRDTKKVRGTYKYVWVTTAAYGDTIFWKYDPDFIQATANKTYK